jgi:prevent-host-death family protein
MERTMEEIGAFDAKNKLSALLDKVERGAEIVITRRGRAVAKLVPIKTGRDREKAREAIRRIRKLAKEMNLGPFDWDEWKKYRDEGRE